MSVNCRTRRLILGYVCYLSSNFNAFDIQKYIVFLLKKGPFLLVRMQNKVFEEKAKINSKNKYQEK